ncbi:hypothetical protein [Bdellovibrio sp. KM01]|uniref:hypothetical protein n=1 Tax=Bdellovibrio sp. KM01 TaxID=2748865 RepID=UPI0015EB04A2|nr:hypothetical protein [Bdellovibrio sp. KM01]QLY26844.1 hypothetical protein HW988_07560 [Bdellovibrio sp. KM01]
MKALLIGLLFVSCLSAGAQPQLATVSTLEKATKTLSKINVAPEITTKKMNPISLFAKTNPPSSKPEKASNDRPKVER